MGITIRLPRRFFRAVALAGIVLLFAFASPHAAADGKVFSRQQVITTIPDQDALIVWDGAVQTLVIETRFVPDRPAGPPADPAAPDYAWIVPVPGDGGGLPEVSATTPGVFTTLRAIFRPRVIAGPVPPLTILFGTIALYFMIVCCRPRSRAVQHLSTALLITVLFLTGLLLLPSLGTARSLASTAAGERVVSLNRTLVGSYDVATIATAKDAKGAEVSAWLTNNGFAVPPGVEPVLDDYASRGWLFIASRLRAPDAALGADATRLAPHPLVITFKTRQPVYPLKLTGVGNGPLAVDLYIFGPGQAAADGFTTVRCSTPVRDKSSLAAQAAPAVRERQWTRAHAGKVRLGHPELLRLIANAPTATKLSATLTPEQMTRDAAIRFEPAAEVGSTVYTRSAARATAANVATGALAAALLPLVVWCVATRAEPRSSRRGVLILSLLSIAVGLAWYAALPRVAATQSPIRGLNSFQYWGQETSTRIVDAIADQRKADPGFKPTVEWVRAQVRQSLQRVADAEYTRSAQPREFWSQVREEDSPFGYTVRDGPKPGTVEFLFYDAIGAEHDAGLGPLE